MVAAEAAGEIGTELRWQQRFHYRIVEKSVGAAWVLSTKAEDLTSTVS